MSRILSSTSFRSGTRSTPVRVTGAVAAIVLLILLGAVPGLHAAEDRSALSGIVNLNTASVEQLQLLPGVGEVRASAIIDARKQSGGFKSVDDLMEVKGVGPSLLERLRPYVAVTGKTTIKAL
ncbi:MAG: helix-hairpin-helix domain-containing protein [Deltaproteobacteria bacterium]|nr:helix-hairpin-helix domain-containing protein [Deltaproteobacteria bacterium]MBW2418655.1 helix-hairpin-helix domain-containing protein [Deltaproteobacteria bacterium]